MRPCEGCAALDATGRDCRGRRCRRPPAITRLPAPRPCPCPADGQPIRGERDKKAIYDVVKAHLLGTSVAQQQLLAAASGAGAGAGGAPLAAAGAAGLLSGGSAALGVPTGSSLQDAGQHSLLRALSGKWRGAQH